MTSTPTVAAVIVTYGKRWGLLSRAVEAVMKDEYIKILIIVDNGSKNEEDIVRGVSSFREKVQIVRSDKNLGSAGGFALGIEHVRKVDCDYVLLLDDDNLLEDGAVALFLDVKKKIGQENVVLVGNRVNIPGNQEIYYSNEQEISQPKKTFFETISYKKIKHFLDLAFGKDTLPIPFRTKPKVYVANESFVYGGAFLPIEAVRKAPLPDGNLVLYGDDIEYSWGVKDVGYSSYVCYSPKIYDIEMSFGEGSQVVGMFDEKVLPYKIFYRIRNMVLISRRNSQQSVLLLFFNIVIWTIGVCVLGLLKYGINFFFLKKVRLIIQAVYNGYFPTTALPKDVLLP